ncbi:MAG TPA: TIGR02757 family protein [Ignavibacteriaceae bacterium]|nr:TIGR02757 family protein [Ignavibacteriaceae bacterium]
MNLKQKLEYHYKAFDRTKLEPDPLQFLHLFDDPKDIEIIGLLASIFAYGNVKQIENTVKKFILIFKGEPYLFIKNFSIENDSNKLAGIKHRFYTEDDILKLFFVLSKELKVDKSIKNIFLKGYNFSDKNVKSGISNFSNHFLNSFLQSFGEITNGMKFMFPLPEKGSACKRMNLFLRWMVRKDELDFGLWNEIPTHKLVIPVDTHIARICKSLKLTRRKNVSWQMAEEITQNLKKYDSNDPIKYDFAICHIGIRKLKF